MFVLGLIPGKRPEIHTIHCKYYLNVDVCIVVHLNSLIKALKELFVLQR